MLTPSQREQIVAILDTGADLTIATVRDDGYPQATTVSYASEGLNIYFGTWTKSQKALNLAKCDKISVTTDLPYASWSEIKGLSLGGRARRVEDPAEMGKIAALMFKKFPQLGAFIQPDNTEMALFRIDAEVFSILDYSKGFGHTELVQV